MSDSQDAVVWTPEAEAKLKEIPFFVRPAARRKIEQLAREQGQTQITIEVYDQARKKFS
ncbi:PCP reductase family protein [Leptolyngbya sp. FACHB-261]|uniref:PCP reductase family protein n=1 Tax=Leptolyngbya sp. FACHB-261 TaxID=2692806 RepID=UPI00168877C9|nr:PCP reductase family protein [Leptolyngbya sp. FACHB-261]MBD2102634.1 PCP reductase family protein [Leptolyngbya sp. FACHB-261]